MSANPPPAIRYTYLFVAPSVTLIATCVFIDGDLHAQMLCANVDTSGDSACMCDGLMGVSVMLISWLSKRHAEQK